MSKQFPSEIPGAFKFSDEARQIVARVLKLDDPGDPEGNHDVIIEEIEAWVALYHHNLKPDVKRGTGAAEKKAMDDAYRAGLKFQRLFAKVDTFDTSVDIESFRKQLEDILRDAALAGQRSASKKRPEAFEWLVGRLADLFEARRGVASMSFDDANGVYRRNDFYLLVEACIEDGKSNVALGEATKRVLAERRKKRPSSPA